MLLVSLSGATHSTPVGKAYAQEPTTAFHGPARAPGLPPLLAALRSRSPGPCSLQLASRRRLGLGGGIRAYIEPAAIASSSRGLLLAGTHNFLWRFLARGRGEDVSGDTVLGVLVTNEARPLLVRPPVQGAQRSLGAIRVLAGADDSWDVIWSENATANSTASPTAAGLWYGHYQGGRWHSVQALPFPEGYRVVSTRSSALIRVGDTLAFAVPIDRPTWPLKKVAVLRLVKGTWQFDVINTYDAVEVTLSYARGFVLAVVEPDSTLSSDASSLFLYKQSALSANVT